MGGALGLAILASVSVLYTDHLTKADYRAPILALNDGFRLAFLIAAGFAAVGAFAAFRFIPRVVRPAVASAVPNEPPPGGEEASQQSPPPPAAASATAAATVARPVDRSAYAEAPVRAPASPAEPDDHTARAPKARIATVTLSIPGGGRWPLASGSSTLRPASQQNRGQWLKRKA
jgi:hypothetical protein